MSRFVHLCGAVLVCLALGPFVLAPVPIRAADAPVRTGATAQGLPDVETAASRAEGGAQRRAQHLAQTAAPRPKEGAKEGSCAPANIACRCSFQCCGEERCDGSVCTQCVIDCVQRQQVVDQRSQALRARCQSLISRGFKRL